MAMTLGDGGMATTVWGIQQSTFWGVGGQCLKMGTWLEYNMHQNKETQKYQSTIMPSLEEDNRMKKRIGTAIVVPLKPEKGELLCKKVENQNLSGTSV